MDKPKNINKGCMYVGIFAQDPKTASKIVSTCSKQAILQILKTFKPQQYLKQQEIIEKYDQIYNIQCQPSQNVLLKVQNDLNTFQTFNQPKDNYHITSLFIGKNEKNLKQKQKNILKSWISNKKQLIQVQFIVYVPGHIIAGYSPNTGNVQNNNQYPHVTLFLKNKAVAVESNDVLTLIGKKLPQIMKKRDKKVTCLDICYGNVCQSIFVIDTKFQFEGITGDNISHGRK